MQWNKQTCLILTVFLFLLFINLAKCQVEAPRTTHFGLTDYGTYINFDSTSTFSRVYRENNYWTFDGYSFQVQNANLTINKFFEDRQLIFTVNASTGVDSTTKIYIPGKSAPQNVTGATSWSFDWQTNILTVNVHHSSPQQVIATWSEIGWSMDINTLVVWFWFVIGLLSLLPLGIAFSTFLASLKQQEVQWKSVPTLIPVVFLVFIAILILRALLGVV